MSHSEVSRYYWLGRPAWPSGGWHLAFGHPSFSDSGPLGPTVQPQKEQGNANTPPCSRIAPQPPGPLPAILLGNFPCRLRYRPINVLRSQLVGRTPSSGRLTVVLISLINVALREPPHLEARSQVSWDQAQPSWSLWSPSTSNTGKRRPCCLGPNCRAFFVIFPSFSFLIYEWFNSTT